MLTIKPNFKIPCHYERVFILESGEHQMCIVVDRKGIHYGSRGKENPKMMSRELDWMEETLAAVRMELEP